MHSGWESKPEPHSSGRSAITLLSYFDFNPPARAPQNYISRRVDYESSWSNDPSRLRVFNNTKT